MLKNNVTLLAICFALFIATVCGNQRTSNITNTVSKISTNHLSSIQGTPPPDSSPKTVRVRLMEVETNGDVVDWPSPGSEIIIKAGATSLSKKLTITALSYSTQFHVDSRLS
jgi:hypothetical protein